MITWLKINFGQWPDHVDRPKKFLRCHVSTFLTGQNKEKKLTLDTLQAQNYPLLGLVVAKPFKVAEHSFGSLWVYVICQIKARERLQLTSWNLESKNILMKEFDWEVKCDVFVVSMATWTIEYNLWLACHHVQYSPQIDTNEKSCSFTFGTFRSIAVS